MSDYAGGTAVHINAGTAALGLALVLGKRVGFNVGAASDPDEAGLIVFNTLAAPAAAILGWIIVEKLRTGKATAVGAVSGVVAGLVAITPACANLTPGWALLHRPVRRWRCGPVGSSDDQCSRGSNLLLRDVVVNRNRHSEDHRIPRYF
jgi:ammonia channel protein AmtB